MKTRENADLCAPKAPAAYLPAVRGTPGLHTLKNLLATALEPAGTALYIYGGGWNPEDTGAGEQARTIGVPPSWVEFFNRQDEYFSYQNVADPARGDDPRSGRNECRRDGADCSGYMGWAVYNVMNRRSGGAGFVCGASGMAADFAARDWGALETEPMEFRPGDVFSLRGHVWLCLGPCGDGSLVILHSTPSPSRRGCPGGGVQLSAVGKSPSCGAMDLARRYMARFPEWDRRYGAVWKDLSSYTARTGSGRFRWDLAAGPLKDPDGFAAMGAGEILPRLFRETPGTGTF